MVCVMDESNWTICTTDWNVGQSQILNFWTMKSMVIPKLENSRTRVMQLILTDKELNSCQSIRKLIKVISEYGYEMGEEKTGHSPFHSNTNNLTF